MFFAKRFAPLAAAVAVLVSRPARADDGDLAAFVDGVVVEAMRTKGIAGVQVAVVDADRTLYAHAYGIASREPHVDVDPARTLFRIASISKTFTYLAAMQLVEQHRLDPQAPANDYLPEALRIPDAGYPPVKLVHLMTHTAGFEDSTLPHLFHMGDGPVETLDGYLARRRPARVRPPGVHAVYSNYSVGLLGAIVAHVSGEPYEAYVEKHLLSPLGMEHTSFREALAAADARRIDDARAGDFSLAFKRDAGGFTAEPFEHIAHLAPAGSASSCAADMTRWMRMLLGGGVLDGHVVLGPDAFRDLTTVTFRNADEVGGIAHGLFRLRYGRYESLEHGGATLAFHSNLVVLPEAGLGVFVTTNTDTGSELAGDLPRLVFERLRPGARPDASPAPPDDFAAWAKRFAGTYLSERRPLDTFEKLPLALASRTTVSVGSDGTLVVASGGVARRWAPDGGHAFRSIETGRRMAFLEDPAGHVTGFASASGSDVSDRVGRLDDPMTVFLVLGILAALSVGVLLGAWRRPRAPPTADRLERATGRAGVFAAAAWVSFVVVFGVGLAALLDPFEALLHYPTPLLRVAVALATVAALLAVASLALLVLSWRRSTWTRGRRARHAAFVAVMLAATALLVQWKVLFAPYVLGG